MEMAGLGLFCDLHFIIHICKLIPGFSDLDCMIIK